MRKFEEKYKELDPAQRLAVDTIDGPVLVIAGPGTGKTEVLSLRVANILKQTGLDPNNILCLTFTDNAARNMRERLESIIGQAAYHVGIHTFHSFGQDIIAQYPDYFTHRQLLQQVDELGRYELLNDIFEKLPHSNPFSVKSGEEFVMIKDALGTISWFKQNALSPLDLHKIIKANSDFIEKIAGAIAETFAKTPSSKELDKYNSLLQHAESQLSGKRFYGFPELGTEFVFELSQAIDGVDASSRFAPTITAWRNKWCIKNASGQHVLKDGGRNLRKMHALVNIYQQLLDEMSRQGLYDFDDMIIESVHALENNAELRLTTQERYQYILVDEFQDTNKAQLRMLTSLGDNPINEDRPNIMAVGDDDQAIYAFQGAEVSNIVAFSKLYGDPALITLDINYRSTPDILEASTAVARQITDRLESVLPITRKELTTQAAKGKAVLHNTFLSELAQYDWLAKEVQKLIKNGAQPDKIAILGPRHKYLERLVPYLGSRQIPVAYERRENILDAPVIKQLLSMSALIVAIAENNQKDVDTLFGEVLAQNFWGISDDDLISLSLECYNKHKHWLEVLHSHNNKSLRAVADWFVSLARHSSTEPMEYILDELMGVLPDGIDNEYDAIEIKKKAEPKFISPMREYYFNPDKYELATDAYLAVLGQLSTLRQRLRQWQPNRTLYTSDLIEFANLHQQAHLKIIDENPHTQTTNAVQVMTVFKAKGLEFDNVFLINAQDEVWGPTARSASTRISLPKNLPTATSSDSDNDKLRILFVALTRARHSLIITSYTNDMSNKLSPGLSFIGGNSHDSVPIHSSLKPHYFSNPDTVQAKEILATDWAYRFRQIIADKPSLFEPILSNYRLSVTHLNNFVDISDAGPQYFMVHNLLRFPEALTPAAAYGDAFHRTLQWLNTTSRTKGKLPSIKTTQSYFADMLERKHLRDADFKRLLDRGQEALKHFVEERGSTIDAKDLIERGFNNEGVVVGGARLSGKVDKMHFLNAGGLQVVDFKTGKPALSWQGKDEYEKIKLHKYRQQLLFYKLLIENSASYSGKLTVRSGALEFVEPNEDGSLVENLVLEYDQGELVRFSRLIAAIWQHIMDLNFPDTANYHPNLKDIKRFEEDLLEGKI